ncbi:MAG: C-type lectin domain protein [Flavipsychrobacter sp.]|jgi:hypothetical protein|nr:C-type lectin domain protein [Flavipsychrobacter sp.]
MKTLIVSMLCLVAGAAASIAQATYHKQICSLPGFKNISAPVYAGRYDTGVLLVTGNSILRFNEHTGVVNSCRNISLGDTNLVFNSVYKWGSVLYITANTQGPHSNTGCILKYDLFSNNIVWQKNIKNSVPVQLYSITGDGNRNLYLCGQAYDTASGSDFVIVKIDTNGTLDWAERIGDSSSDDYPSAILYRHPGEVYLSGVSYTGMLGRSVILKFNDAGSILQTNAVAATSGRRINGSSMAIINNDQFIVVNPTIIGHDGVGRTLIRVLDAALGLVRTTAIGGMDVRAIFCNEHTLLISAQAPIMDGYEGFRSVRMDTDLNVTGARYFNRIRTFSPASSAACFINADNGSFHFFKTSGSDSIHIIRTNANEMMFCEDTDFSPVPAPIGFADTTYVYQTGPFTMDLFNLSAVVSAIEVAGVEQCVPNSISVQEVDEAARLLVYPNPAKNEINISLKKGTPYEARITDIRGRPILTTHSKDKIDIAQLAGGVYFITVTCEHAIYTAKFIKK